MESRGYGVCCYLPVPALGRLRLPRQQVRFRDGVVRFGLSEDKTEIVCSLVDRDDVLLRVPDRLSAAVLAERMGRAVELMLAKYNRYQAGELAGDPSRIIMAT